MPRRLIFSKLDEQQAPKTTGQFAIGYCLALVNLPYSKMLSRSRIALSAVETM